jgi:hypothetical protein
MAKLVAEVSEGKIRSSGTEPLSTFLDDWLQHLETLGRSPTTLREYRRIVDKIVNKIVNPELDKVKVSKLSARHHRRGRRS